MLGDPANQLWYVAETLVRQGKNKGIKIKECILDMRKITLLSS